MRDVMCVAHVTGVKRKTVRIWISEPVLRAGCVWPGSPERLR